MLLWINSRIYTNTISIRKVFHNYSVISKCDLLAIDRILLQDGYRVSDGTSSSGTGFVVLPANSSLTQSSDQRGYVDDDAGDIAATLPTGFVFTLFIFALTRRLSGLRIC